MSGQPLIDVLVFLFGTGATIATLLQRLPFWNDLSATVKVTVVAIVNIVAPMVLILLKAYIPPDILAQTPQQIVAGFVALGLSFLWHLVDEWLISKSQIAKEQAYQFTG